LWRAVVFVLSAMSIWCLLVDFYSIVSMRVFTLYVFVPACIVLIALAAQRRFPRDEEAAAQRRHRRLGWVRGGGGVRRVPVAVCLCQRVAHRVGRAADAALQGVFGLRADDPRSSWAQSLTSADHVVGWTYHFSNGITFGIMYMAMVGDPTKRSRWWGVVMAVAIEIALLCSPYTQFFGIPLNAQFVAVTLTAHVIFGAVMGLCARRLAGSPFGGMNARHVRFVHDPTGAR
jgi:hypothetical protein